ncbi:MAG: cytochrome c-550 [Leptolyngbya sp. SIO1E4]|nr:cytochrome c-550 [Leptolyngbya sp. SIO1E4]
MLSSLKKTLINSAIFSVIALLISATLWADVAIAIEVDDAYRTVPLNDSGEQITLSEKQLAIGQRKFNGSCAQCHLDGATKTNPSVDLSAETLSLASPPRNTVESVVDYLQQPTTYDGLASITELHPSTARTDLFPKMRDLTDDDLTAIAGYILVQPKILGDQWAGGKPKR